MDAPMPDQPVVDLAHAIQLSVAPVFLLTGVGALLGVMASRLGRIIDRVRVLEEENLVRVSRDPATAQAELDVLRRRALLINRAISLCTFSALLVAGVVASLFLATFVHLNLRTFIAATFVFAMLSLMLGLVTFLREVHASIRFMQGTGGRR
jgi:hypothetical protein